MRSLDTSVVLALVRGKPGADVASRLMSGGVLSTVSYTEVVGTPTRRGFDAQEVRTTLADLPIALVDLDAELAYRAGVMEPATRREGLSLGDRAGLALAERH